MNLMSKRSEASLVDSPAKVRIFFLINGNRREKVAMFPKKSARAKIFFSRAREIIRFKG
jgi:hypothetical protein